MGLLKGRQLYREKELERRTGGAQILGVFQKKKEGGATEKDCGVVLGEKGGLKGEAGKRDKKKKKEVLLRGKGWVRRGGGENTNRLWAEGKEKKKVKGGPRGRRKKGFGRKASIFSGEEKTGQR